MDDTVIIEHERWGRVEGIKKKNVYTTIWMKNGAHYFGSDGWREVPKPKWVTVAVRRSEREVIFLDGTDIRLIVPYGYRWKTVEVEREVEG